MLYAMYAIDSSDLRLPVDAVRTGGENSRTSAPAEERALMTQRAAVSSIKWSVAYSCSNISKSEQVQVQVPCKALREGSLSIYFPLLSRSCALDGKHRKLRGIPHHEQLYAIAIVSRMTTLLASPQIPLFLSFSFFLSLPCICQVCFRRSNVNGRGQERNGKILREGKWIESPNSNHVGPSDEHRSDDSSSSSQRKGSQHRSLSMPGIGRDSGPTRLNEWQPFTCAT